MKRLNIVGRDRSGVGVRLSSLRCLSFLRAELEPSQSGRLATLHLSNSVLNQIDQLLDHGNLVFLRVFVSVLDQSLFVDLLDNLRKEGWVNRIDYVEEPGTIKILLGRVLLLVELRDILHDLLTILDSLEDLVDRNVLPSRHRHWSDIEVVHVQLLATEQVLQVHQRAPSPVR